MSIYLLLLLPLTSAFLLAPQPVLQNVTYGGSGCPTGALAQARLSSFNTTTNTSSLVHSISSLTPRYGSNIPITEMRKTCSLNLNITVPPEWMIRANRDGTLVQGYVQLADNLTMTWKGAHIFKDITRQSGGTFSIKGPYDGFFLHFVPSPDFGLPWVESPCGGGTLWINHQVRITSTVNPLPVWPGEPEVDPNWKFTTDLQVLPCGTT